MNSQDRQGCTLLARAVASRASREVLETILAAGADPNLADASGRRPLQDCVRRADPETAELLLAAGANPSGAALVEAVEVGHADIVRLLMQYGARPVAQVEKLALRLGREEIVKLLRRE